MSDTSTTLTTLPAPSCESCGSHPAQGGAPLCDACRHAVEEHGALRSNAYAVECDCAGTRLHVTSIRGGGVHGHECKTDAGDDCGGISEGYWSDVDAAEVEVGRTYEIDSKGAVLAVED